MGLVPSLSSPQIRPDALLRRKRMTVQPSDRRLLPSPYKSPLSPQPSRASILAMEDGWGRLASVLLKIKAKEKRKPP